jgi:hypothetical protein
MLIQIQNSIFRSRFGWYRFEGGTVSLQTSDLPYLLRKFYAFSAGALIANKIVQSQGNRAGCFTVGVLETYVASS